MADGAKNVGQVAGIWIGNVAPENTNIIWFDTNTSERRHKVYDFGQMKWVTLNPQIVVPTTYNELVNTARQSGLSVGSMYKLTDMSNVLAYAVTTTKVQYNDNKGNIIVDDLGTGKEYHVSSSNLLIDGVRGVFDTATNQLIFSFVEDSIDEDVYLFGKKKVNNVWKLVKSKISALISSKEGNSISWKNGLFFSFNNAINAILNKRGGVVGKTAYDKDMEEIAQDIENVGKENQRILSTAKKYTDDKTTDDEIFGKKITDDIADAQPIDVHKNMTLKDIVANFQRWLTRLRWATGVKLTRSFTQSRTFQWINSNDTVESAFGKVQYIFHNFTDTLTIPGDFTQNDGVTDEQYIKDEKFRNKTLRDTFAMLVGFLFNVVNHSRIKELDLVTEYPTNETDLKRELNYLERNTAEDGANSVITYSRKVYLQANESSQISKLEDAIGLPTNIKLKYRDNLVAYDQWLEGSYIRFGTSGPVISLVDIQPITNENPGIYVKRVSANEDGIGVDVEWGYNPAYDQGQEVPVPVAASDVCSIYIKFNYLDIQREQLLQIPIKRLFPGQSMDEEDAGINITIGKALELIVNFISDVTVNSHLRVFSIADNINNQTEATPVQGENIHRAFAKLGGWFNDLTKHIIFDIWEYSKVTFTYSEKEIVDLKDKSLYAVMQLVASYLEDTWANAHMNKEELPLPEVTDETDLIDQINHKTGADNMGVNIYEAIGVITAFIKNNMDTHHIPDDFQIDDWEQIKDFALTDSTSWQGQSLGFALKKLIGIVTYGSKLIDVSLPEDFALQAPITDATFTDQMAGKKMDYVFSYVLGYIKVNTSAARLPSGWQPKQITSNIPLPEVGDNIDDVVAKIVGKLEQIGDISNGMVQSKALDSANRRVTQLNLGSGSLAFNQSPYAMNLNSNKIQIDKNGSSQQRFYASNDQMVMYANNPSYYNLWVNGMPSWWGIYGMGSFITQHSSSNKTGAVMGANTNGNENNFGGIFTSVMIGGMVLDCLTITAGDSVTLNKFVSCAMALTKSDINITLPAAPPSGRTIYIIQGGSADLHIHANGNDHIDRRGSSQRDIDFNIRGAIFTFTYVSGVAYESTPVDGLWFVSYASAL